MKISEILKGVEYELIKGNDHIDVNKIEYDSRNIEEGDMFFCVEGFKVDGHDFIQKAMEKGAKVLICTRDIDININVTIIKVKDSRKALAIAASNYYGNPCEKLKIIGITGTNGKTTCTYMIKSILEKAGFKVGIIGTIANYIGNNKIKSERTTPESLELHKLFKDMVNENVDYCVMEVSSHSLSLDRVYGVTFCEGFFTNLTQDHLDFHKTFEEYFKAKFKLFTMSNRAIVNLDDNYGKKIKELLSSEVVTYGMKECTYDLKAEDVHITPKGISFNSIFKEQKETIKCNLPGKYNVYNALGSAAVCLMEGIDRDTINKGLNEVVVPGRCEILTKDHSLGFDIIVDYAHTPDSLDNILSTVREFTKGRVISVFGCGGDRDKTKRPIMGKIGSDLSDIAIVTSDNPRSEEPIAIINDVISGIKKDNYMLVENRKEAIKKAMTIAKPQDVIVIAGKGHEDYQILKDKTIHFDEREVVQDIIKELF